MPLHIKIRGAYSTALTRFALDRGFEIVNPSDRIRRIFRSEFADAPDEVFIRDREDRQGIELRGQADAVAEILASMQDEFLDAVLIGFKTLEENDRIALGNLEFPGASKEKLDELRGAVVPTLKNHHRLKLIESDLLLAAEAKFARDPGRKTELERTLVQETILEPLAHNGVMRLEHIRPSGKSMRPREGIIQRIDESGVVFKRSFSQGRYDGLNVPIRRGDYGLTEIRFGEWHVKHSYFSKEHRLIGEYYNINTPVEIYPYGARYMDLEVDVIRRSGENAFAIDREKLAMLSRGGCIGKNLECKALLVAEQIMRSLNGEG